MPFRGARLTTDPDGAPVPDENPIAAESALRRRDLIRRAHAYATVAPRHAFFSGVTAAVLWQLPVPLHALRGEFETGDGANSAAPARALDVGVLAPHRAFRGKGVRSRKIRGDLVEVRKHEGLRIASPASVWAQLALELSVDELIELGDAIIREPRQRGMRRAPAGSGLATIEQLASAIDAGRRIGVAKLRAALPQLRIGSSSPAETRFRLALIRNGMPEPQLDIDVFDADGNAIGFTEFAYPDHRILVEYEGDHHRVSRAQWHRDIEKHAACAAAGWTVVRITSLHMRNGAAAGVTQVREALIRAGWRAG
jgi:hypothetical protein